MSHKAQVNSVAWHPIDLKFASGANDDIVKIWDIEGNQLQNDQSDQIFSVIAPEVQSIDVDMGNCVLYQSKDTVITRFIENRSNFSIRIDSLFVRGEDKSNFSILSRTHLIIPPYSAASIEIEFIPENTRVYMAEIVVVTSIDTLIQQLTGTGVASKVTVINPYVDFGEVFVGSLKDTSQVLTLRNIINSPVIITDIYQSGPNFQDFIRLDTFRNVVLEPNTDLTMNLRFSPSSLGRINGGLYFNVKGESNPKIVQLYGKGIYRDTVFTLIKANDIVAQPGEICTLYVYMQDSKKTELPNAPREFDVTLSLPKNILYVNNPDIQCETVDDNACQLVVTGIRENSDTLVRIPCIATLGNTKYAPINITDFVWKTKESLPVEIKIISGSIDITGLCEDEEKVRLFIPHHASQSLNVRPNPAFDILRIEYGIAETTTVMIELINISGVEVVTPVLLSSLPRGQYVSVIDIVTVPQGIYILRMTTRNSVMHTRVDILK